MWVMKLSSCHVINTSSPHSIWELNFSLEKMELITNFVHIDDGIQLSSKNVTIACSLDSIFKSSFPSCLLVNKHTSRLFFRHILPIFLYNDFPYNSRRNQ